MNPQYEKMLPTMSQEEFEQLKESIRTEGQHYPIIVSESLEVLDGHHRFRACLELDIEPDFEVKHFEDKLLEKKFVIEANLRRRHLNNFQLVELAVPLLEIEKALAKKQKSQNDIHEHGSPSNSVPDNSFSEFEPTGKTTAAVAKRAGVSTRTLEKGKKIIEKASEDDKQKLREGKTSISKVYREITPPKPTQKNTIKSETLLLDPEILRNKEALTAILNSIIEQNISCPACGNKIFQCSQCHKPLNELVKSEKQSEKTVKPPQEQPQQTQSDESIETDELPIDDGEGFKDEFF
ncbi:MAG: ParB N-terminal domain-containing protein [Candidatus Bathyarchaeota archaeon]|nr:ParB N-terminal domain-containing protein [Candidatus Termiticorpusculum sp.]